MKSNFADLSISNGEEGEIVHEDLEESGDHNTSDHCPGHMQGVTIKPVGEGRFMFQFYHFLDVKRVLDGSPWSFNNHPLILHPLQKGEHPHRVPLNKLPFWVQIYDLPHGFISKKEGIQLGNFVGKFLEYDKSNRGAAWMSYTRIRVEVDTAIPLRRWKKITQKNGESFVHNSSFNAGNSILNNLVYEEASVKRSLEVVVAALLFLWNNKVSCSLLSYSLNHIDIEVVEGTRRHLSWNLLKHISRVNSLPCVIIGDFNDLLCGRDKRGSIPHPLHLFRGFCEVVDACGVWNVELIVHPYTWSHRRGSSTFVEERQDRAMGNSLWHDLFSRSKLYSLVASTSGHNPILLDMAPVVVWRKFRTFKFENNWFEEKELPKVVRKYWDGFWDFDVTRRLLATSETLDLWGRHIFLAFRNNKKELENTIKRLQSRVDRDSAI
ncbi:hypothetical protein ACS0TY_030732 [Phlomoides rotata]